MKRSKQLDEKQTFWNKAKAFLKKYWHIIATFVAGVFTSIFLFHRFPKQSLNRSDELGDTLDELGTGLTEAGDTVSDIRDGNADAIHTVERQRQTIDDIRDGHTDITDSSREIGQSISRLKELIEAERKRIEESEISE
ncbi:MAG: hypothetical protein ACOWWR_15805 [Eubacteriales bacterium]